MVVQHNLQAINANRMLNVTSSGQAKATEKLSSGYKINRAADDAAGLAISEKMRKQMRGLDRASINAQDGVSAVQTAEGALNEVHDMLQRLNELAVQAANGTNSLSDRESIQDEITELTTEIDRVSETTRFNETELLKGAVGTKTKYLKGHDAGIKGTFVDSVSVAHLYVDLHSGSTTMVAGQKYNIVNAYDTSLAKGTTVEEACSSLDLESDFTKQINYKDKIEVLQDALNHIDEAKDLESEVTINGTKYVRVVSMDGQTKVWSAGTGSEYTSDQLKEKIKDGTNVVLNLASSATANINPDKITNGGTYTADMMNGTYIARDYTDKQKNKGALEVIGLIVNAMEQANCVGVDADKVGEVNVKIKNPNVDPQYLHQNGTDEAYEKEFITFEELKTNLSTKWTKNDDRPTFWGSDIEFRVEKQVATIPNTLSFDLHVGADADMGNKIVVGLEGMTAAGLGIQNLNVADDSGIAATYAIDAIGDALQVISAQRAELGAIQNRLEHTIANLDNVVENTTAAESRIRDTDMAEEMVEYSKNNILQQAGQSMLAQANQSTQGVLSLLQG